MHSKSLIVVTASLLLFAASAQAQSTNACDLNGDGTVNNTDVTLARNMSLGSTPCSASINVFGVGVCNVVVVQRVTNAMSSGTCLPHYVTLTWNGSTGATGYNVYRSTTSNDPNPTKLTPAPITVTSFTDTSVQGAQTYYYVTKAVNGSGESGPSNQATAAVPGP